MRHLRLDALGGMAGDMFVAALLDAFPEHEAGTVAAAQTLSGASCRLLAHQDVVAGRRFAVHVPGHAAHDHVDWRDIRARIGGADLPAAVRDHAIGIFSLLAEAEAEVHGVRPEKVRFHEVGAADSIADIVAAGWLIATIEASTWSVGVLPLGGGQVRTAHGAMPVPAPATALLLKGFSVVDDGIAGERVTPTGAAILRYLNCAAAPQAGGRLAASGTGFGTRKLPGIANVLRVLVFEAAGADTGPGQRELAVIAFEVDDQSAEDLACGLDRLRREDGVLDVVQWPAFGKKGRMAAHVQILAQPAAIARVSEACFRETTTIGLRTELVRGLTLPRREQEVTLDERRLRVKLVERPGGVSGKAECDDVLALEGHAARARLRRRAEELAEAREPEEPRQP